MNKLIENVKYRLYALLCAGETNGGSEIVQVVIVLGFAVGLGGALLLLQDQINESIKQAGTFINDTFSSITKEYV